MVYPFDLKNKNMVNIKTRKYHDVKFQPKCL